MNLTKQAPAGDDPLNTVAPSGFCQSVFRSRRDPNIVTDDSGASLGTQVYNHGWLLSETLVSYLSEQSVVQSVSSPTRVGMKYSPWWGRPWSTRREYSRDGGCDLARRCRHDPADRLGRRGAGRRVATILDLLAATTSTQRDTIESTYSSTKASIYTARQNLYAAPATTAVRKQVAARSERAWYLACKAVDAARGPWLENALQDAMWAIVAKEAGLIGTTFTTANYETMAQPIDAVLAMPTGLLGRWTCRWATTCPVRLAAQLIDGSRIAASGWC
ncbi:hypothetical protein EKO23_16390 [Nocardioides guangzhouensis]|uniref:Uncharacterized protein n=1 Tax=Nocardioides guangzhouensis TaxID=2497878 RepID=A0A4Q4Z9I5_9ACTN|nr:hypothetical protein [Nocardioides guangzhouensis]RYP84238.1 hypothetical protein EKO23_16390 [Nocardioides guangzhouensis]